MAEGARSQAPSSHLLPSCPAPRTIPAGPARAFPAVAAAAVTACMLFIQVALSRGRFPSRALLSSKHLQTAPSDPYKDSWPPGRQTVQGPQQALAHQRPPVDMPCVWKGSRPSGPRLASSAAAAASAASLAFFLSRSLGCSRQMAPRAQVRKSLSSRAAAFSRSPAWRRGWAVRSDTE